MCSAHRMLSTSMRSGFSGNSTSRWPMSKPGKHLSMPDPRIVAVKKYVKAEVTNGTVHPLLVGNFDQVWTTLYEPAWKDPRQQGSTKDLSMDAGKFYRRRQLAASLQASLGQQVPALQSRKLPGPKEDDAYSSANSVATWRIPRTTTTLSWRNGDVGRLFTTIASDKVSEQQLKAAKALRGFAVVEKAAGPTHMWKGETMVRYLEFLGEELRLRRAKYNLTLQDKALVICDDATVHTDARFAELRQLWEKEHHCQLLGADKAFRIKVPGGFGASGGPNDQWHQMWRLLRRAWLRKALGGANNPAFGRQYQDLEFDLDGEINMKCPLLVSLASDVYALKALSQHRQGNIIMSAWHKLGYVSAEELAKLRFDGDMDAFAASMSHVQGSMRRLLNLDVLPDLGLDAAAKDLDSSILATALQAKRHVWWIHDEADRCLPLPSWTNRPLELVIMAWVKERQGWDRLLQERGDKGFTAQQQAKYAGVANGCLPGQKGHHYAQPLPLHGPGRAPHLLETGRPIRRPPSSQGACKSSRCCPQHPCLPKSWSRSYQ